MMANDDVRSSVWIKKDLWLASQKAGIAYSPVLNEVLRCMLGLPEDPENELLRRRKEETKLRLRAKYLSEVNSTISKELKTQLRPGAKTIQDSGNGGNLLAPERSYSKGRLLPVNMFLKTHREFLSSIPELIRKGDIDSPLFERMHYQFEECADEHIDQMDFFNLLVDWSRTQT